MIRDLPLIGIIDSIIEQAKNFEDIHIQDFIETLRYYYREQARLHQLKEEKYEKIVFHLQEICKIERQSCP